MQRGDAEAVVLLVRGGAVVASWPLEAAARPGLAVADELARLQLGARRLGCTVRLRGAGAELAELLDLVGLDDLLVDDVGRAGEAAKRRGAARRVWAWRRRLPWPRRRSPPSR